MTAATADRNTAERTGDLISAGVAAAVKCFAGAIAVLDSSGNIKPAVTATGLITVGRFEEYVDNSAGLADALTAVAKRGTFRYANSAAADAIAAAQIGDTCYLVDDQTVAKTDGTGTRSVAGIVADVDSAGVWVRMGFDSYVSPANAEVKRVVSPVAGTIEKIYSTINGALTVGDATLTGKIGATAITNGVVTITQAGSAAGDVDVATPTAARTVAVGDVISVTVGGTQTAAKLADVTILITPSA
jgi:hypothetical protein